MKVAPALSLLLPCLLSVSVTLSVATVTHCDYFNKTTCSGEDTNFALTNYGSCHFSACGGDEVIITTRSTGNYSASCVGDTYLRLNDAAGDLLGYSDDAVWHEKCSEIVFSLPNGYGCQTFESRVGCFGDKTLCEAQVMINVTGECSLPTICLVHLARMNITVLHSLLSVSLSDRNTPSLC